MKRRLIALVVFVVGAVLGVGIAKSDTKGPVIIDASMDINNQQTIVKVVVRDDNGISNAEVLYDDTAYVMRLFGSQGKEMTFSVMIDHILDEKKAQIIITDINENVTTADLIDFIQ